MAQVNEQLRILFLEDVPNDIEMVRRALNESGLAVNFQPVTTREEFIAQLEQQSPDVILSDHGFPNFDGFSALSLAREKCPDVPFIFVTGAAEEEATTAALKSGATDFVLKEKLSALVPAMRRALVTAQERRRMQEQIARLKVELEAAKKELESFSYSISHDLRAPLRHVDGFVDLLQQSAGDKLDETNREYLRIISESAKHMARLLDALLSFSRVGRAPVRKTRLPLEPLVKSVLNDLRYDMEGRIIEWIIGPLPAVEGDLALLRQVLFNLLSNALKYTRHCDPARIQIGSRESPHEVVVFIRDNGIGFDMQFADKLFGVFQRLHGSPEFEGVGIGLANVRRIVQRHGGKTWAEANPGQGATFYFSLPDLPGTE
jgi:light-regulated signal transduction histidine kinase (bacteriophytochrome)